MKHLFIRLAIGAIGFLVWDANADSTAISGSGSNSSSSANAISGSSVSDSLSYSGSSSGATSNIGGNDQVINFNAPGKSTTEVKGTTTVKSAPGVSTGNVFPTAPCMGGTQVGLSGLGWGVAGGTTWKDDDCGIRETARSFNSMGMNMDAVAVLCASPYAKVAPACKGLVAVSSAPMSAPAPVVDQRPAAIANDRKAPAAGGPVSPEKAWVQ